MFVNLMGSDKNAIDMFTMLHALSLTSFKLSKRKQRNIKFSFHNIQGTFASKSMLIFLY